MEDVGNTDATEVDSEGGVRVMENYLVLEDARSEEHCETLCLLAGQLSEVEEGVWTSSAEYNELRPVEDHCVFAEFNKNMGHCALYRDISGDNNDSIYGVEKIIGSGEGSTVGRITWSNKHTEGLKKNLALWNAAVMADGDENSTSTLRTRVITMPQTLMLNRLREEEESSVAEAMEAAPSCSCDKNPCEEDEKGQEQEEDVNALSVMSKLSIRCRSGPSRCVRGFPLRCRDVRLGASPGFPAARRQQKNMCRWRIVVAWRLSTR